MHTNLFVSRRLSQGFSAIRSNRGDKLIDGDILASILTDLGIWNCDALFVRCRGGCSSEGYAWCRNPVYPLQIRAIIPRSLPASANGVLWTALYQKENSDWLSWLLFLIARGCNGRHCLVRAQFAVGLPLFYERRCEDSCSHSEHQTSKHVDLPRRGFRIQGQRLYLHRARLLLRYLNLGRVRRVDHTETLTIWNWNPWQTRIGSSRTKLRIECLNVFELVLYIR